MKVEKGDEDNLKGYAFIYWQIEGTFQYLVSFLDLPPKGIPAPLSRPAAIPVDESNFERLKTIYVEERGADLVYGGSLNPSLDYFEREKVFSQIIEEYTIRYYNPPQIKKEEIKIDIDELLFEISTEKEKLNRIMGLVGRLRDGLKENNSVLVKECTDKIKAIANNLKPGKYPIDDLIKAAQLPGKKGEELANLYLKECLFICDENYEEAKKVIKEIIEKVKEH